LNFWHPRLWIQGILSALNLFKKGHELPIGKQTTKQLNIAARRIDPGARAGYLPKKFRMHTEDPGIGFPFPARVEAGRKFGMNYGLRY